ncbi:cryptochrome/photolyase family protein [Motilibacter deserti]|uniref:Deoxyribodipyrimidine photo-lyase n=1 Tax=Motilibacter deserti TaxID=2714956 RepID=A0ABX0GVQ0_9ACTN|nr:deoxyribodipyrimidine photo-lyase [Motilibacter deserti]NHC14620.1 deoxyribodipyrimidine photo-lyase [Motilibacter deserti]
MATPATAVMWFRRDLRLRDNPALRAALSAGPAIALFVVDPALWGPAGAPRRAWLSRSLRALDAALDGRLVVRHGDPAEVVPAVAREAAAGSVHVAADFGVLGRRRDAGVEEALRGLDVPLVRTGSPYAVAPGTVLTKQGEPFRVFTPFSRAWAREGWPPPVHAPRAPRWVELPSDGVPAEPELDGMQLPEAGEEAALARWRRWRERGLGAYADSRNRPDLDGTSSLSAHLKYGEVHPRTLLADLAKHPGESADRFRTELCWRDFYADVLWHAPHTARAPLNQQVGAIRYDTGPAADAAFAAWAQGRTGYPIVDAGMRQLRAVGWVHNRVRMIVASFLVKDLHVDWLRGARHFMHWLRDGDLASNNGGWQWVAGTGTDAAPYFRVFNPVTQGKSFDPDGEYVRRYVPELRGVAGGAVHEPWLLPGGLPAGYPERVVDHGEARAEALRRYEETRTGART